MLQTNSKILNMKYQFENSIKDRLMYCLEWKQNIDVYLANKRISKKTNEEYYKSKPLLKFIISSPAKSFSEGIFSSLENPLSGLNL